MMRTKNQQHVTLTRDGKASRSLNPTRSNFQSNTNVKPFNALDERGRATVKMCNLAGRDEAQS